MGRAPFSISDPPGPEDFEGLVHRTAQLVAPYVQEELEDIEQVLRVKVWRALAAFDAERVRSSSVDARGRTARERFVFMCLTNQVKDIKNKKRRSELHIEALICDVGEDRSGSRDRFEMRYLSVDAELAYADAEDETPVLPNTLTKPEVEVIELLVAGFKQAEAARALRIEKREMEKVMRSIRTKMGDWRPTPLEAGLELVSRDPEVATQIAA